jgi:hypothetical protein
VFIKLEEVGMTRVRCLLDECVSWHEGFCRAEEIEIDPELGCLTLMESEVQRRNGAMRSSSARMSGRRISNL